VQHIADDQRLENVKFKVAVGASNGNCSVVAHDLSADHGNGLALSWVDLSWHDGRAWLILWERKLSETTAWARSEEADVICDFHKGHGEGVESTTQVDEGVLTSEGLELVGRSHEWVASLFLQVVSDCLSESGESVQAGSDSGASLSNLVDVLESLLNSFVVVLQLMDVGGELLTESERSGILSVSATNLDDVCELVPLGSELVSESLQLGQESLVNLKHSCDVHDGWESIIGRLGAIHVVIWVYHFRAELTSKDLNRTVRDDFVGVHVRLCARSSLPNNQREVVVQLVLSNLVCGLDDCASNLWVQAELEVGSGSRLLQ